MVVSLPILPLSHSIFFGICQGTRFKYPEKNDQVASKRAALRVDSSRPFFKPLRYVQLTCVASEKRWRNKSGSDNWNFKTVATLVEHTYNSARDSVLDVEGLKGSKEQEQQPVNSASPIVSVSTPSSYLSWDSVNSSRVFATSQFSLLLGVVITIFGALTLAGVAFGRWWKQLRWPARHERKSMESWSGGSVAFEAPASFSFFLKKDFKRKETVEWVNMILGKLWKVYRRGLETWLVSLLQPLIDNLKKPSYVRRVKIQDFYLGDEPLSVRSVERKTSRRADDLQYQIGLRYTGEARMLLSITLAAGFVPVVIPVGVRGLDVDGEIWVKLRLIPSEPWVGTATWAFVSLPKIILALAPFGLLNIMTIPFISRFLTKLLTEDLPQLFVKPNKIVINFLNNKAKNPFARQFKDEALNVDNNKDFAGELSVTLVDARKLKYFPIGKTDPYVTLTLGDQVIRSKKNSQTSIIGPPGAPIWNQDFQLLVVDPKSQKLSIRVRDNVGLGVFTVGYGEVDLSTLQDTVPTDKVVPLRGGWGLPKRFSGEILLRLTYKAYVEDEDEDDIPLSSDSDSDYEKDEFSPRRYYSNRGKIGFLKDLFSAVNTVIRDLGYENISVQPSQLNHVKKQEPEPRVATESSEVLPVSNGSATEQPVERSSAVMWLGVATGIALLAAVSINFSNLVNF